LSSTSIIKASILVSKTLSTCISGEIIDTKRFDVRYTLPLTESKGNATAQIWIRSTIITSTVTRRSPLRHNHPSKILLTCIGCKTVAKNLFDI
jgi:hypothetical protein